MADPNDFSHSFDDVEEQATSKLTSKAMVIPKRNNNSTKVKQNVPNMKSILKKKSDPSKFEPDLKYSAIIMPKRTLT